MSRWYSEVPLLGTPKISWPSKNLQESSRKYSQEWDQTYHNTSQLLIATPRWKANISRQSRQNLNTLKLCTNPKFFTKVERLIRDEILSRSFLKTKENSPNLNSNRPMTKYFDESELLNLEIFAKNWLTVKMYWKQTMTKRSQLETESTCTWAPTA